MKLFESGKSSRVIASELCVGRTQVQSVLKRKREIMEEYESNANVSLKRCILYEVVELKCFLCDVCVRINFNKLFAFFSY